MNQTLRLGLIGDNIAASQAPRFHRLAGAQNDIRVTYDRLVPKDLGLEFDALFDGLAEKGFRGVNITYPYKERAAARVLVEDAYVRGIGAVNTVLFTEGGPIGHNTDYTGFISAYRQERGKAAPGKVLLIGAGGAGKAVAFGLLAVGLAEICIVDPDLQKARALGAALCAAKPGLAVEIAPEAGLMAAGCAGLVNCSPVGMVGIGGTPLQPSAMDGATWCFDAVYTPVETEFLKHAKTCGLQTISGYELFFGQGVDAWALFSGRDIDQARMRKELASGQDVP